MTPPTLQLSVQYASALAAPGRGQLRRWALAALAVVAAGPGARRIRQASLTIRFVDDDEGRAINRTFRGKDYATNVLTFPYDDGTGPEVQADLVVCMPVLDAEARAHAKSRLAHCAHLVIHGVLHASGHDHERQEDADAMEELERQVLARFRIADPYDDPQ